MPLTLRLRRAALDVLVFRKLRAALGGDVRWVIFWWRTTRRPTRPFLSGVPASRYSKGGASPRQPRLPPSTDLMPSRSAPSDHHSRAPLCELPTTASCCVRGLHVFDRYWADPDATAAARDADGFFHTGDLGAIDDDGFITITGRKKEILVTAGGKNVSPAQLEDRLRSHPLIAQAMVIGDRRPYIAALNTIDEDALANLEDEGRQGPVAEPGRPARRPRIAGRKKSRRPSRTPTGWCPARSRSGASGSWIATSPKRAASSLLRLSCGGPWS